MNQPTRYTQPVTGRGIYCEPGGRIAALHDDLEERVLKVAAEDIAKSAECLKNEVSRNDLVRALSYLVQSAKVVLDVANSRGERLKALTPSDEETSAD